MGNDSYEFCREKQNTYFMFNTPLGENVPFMR